MVMPDMKSRKCAVILTTTNLNVVGVPVGTGMVLKGQIAEPVFTLLQMRRESIFDCPGLEDMLFLYMFHVATVGLLIVNVPYPYISAFLKEELYGTWADVLPNVRHFAASGRCIIRGGGWLRLCPILSIL